MQWMKEILVMIMRLIVLFIVFYILGFFGSEFVKPLLQDKSMWQLLLVISGYMVVTVFLFYCIGKFFAKSERGNRSTNFVFVGMVFACEIVLILKADNIKIMKEFLWESYYGWAAPIYNVAEQVVKSDINSYKYVFISYWIIVSFALLAGLHKRDLPVPRSGELKRICLSLVVVMVVIINATTIRNILTPRMFSSHTYPKIDGATAAIPLGQVLAQKLLGKDALEAEDFVEFNTTHDAYMNLIHKKADVIFAAEPSKEQLQLAEENGVHLKCTPIGTDAFVFIVNKENPVEGLTIQEIREIYSGKRTNWKEVGGLDEEIMAYQRPQNSGSQTLMENVVMKGETLMEAPAERSPNGMIAMLQVVDYKNASNAIGYSIYYFANVMHKKENIKFLAINGIPCNKETIASKTYPFAGSLYAVTRENGETESTKKLLGVLTSEEGQKMVEEGGFVPLSDGHEGK